MSYGLAYGLSAHGLSQQLKISTEEANGADGRIARSSAVRDHLRAVVERPARTAGHLDGAGRRRHPPELDSKPSSAEVMQRGASADPGRAADIVP